jgi:AcrR family transcriptional regulator
MLSPVPPDRQAEIVHVAYRLIAERGLEGLRFADVAREAGINNGTLLYYFASKNALIQAVGAYLVQQFSQTGAPSATLETEPPNALDQLRWEFTDAREHLPDQLSVVYTELLLRGQRDPSVAAMLRDIDANWQGWLTGLLRRGQQSGAIRSDVDLDLVSTTIMACIRGVGMQAMVADDPTTLDSVMETLAELIERWVAAPQPPTAAATALHASAQSSVEELLHQSVEPHLLIGREPA